MNSLPSKLSLKCYTWHKDANEWIDYNSAILNRNIYDISEKAFIYRKKNEVEVESEEITDSNASNSSLEWLGNLSIKNGKYYYNGNQRNWDGKFEDHNWSWLVYKDKKIPDREQRYVISEGDIVKLGRILLIIREIKIKCQNKQFGTIEEKTISSMLNDDITNWIIGNEGIHRRHKVNNFNIGKNCVPKSEDREMWSSSIKDGNKGNSMKNNKPKTLNRDSISIKLSINKNITSTNNRVKIKKICRICYMDNFEDDINNISLKTNSDANPLIAPCHCSGSMKYIHLNCWRQWWSSKIVIKNNFSNSESCSVYSINQVNCELCKDVLPDYIRHSGEVYSWVDFSEGDKIKDEHEQYIIFDTWSADKKNNNFRYIVKFDDKNQILIGRGFGTQWMFNDISISRNHCLFQIEKNNKVSLVDLDSKFGTLVLLQCPSMEIIHGKPLTIQIGRSYMVIGYKKSFSWFGCCVSEVNETSNSYSKMNKRYIYADRKRYIKDDREDEDDNEWKEEEAVKDEKPNIDSDGKNESEHDKVHDINNNKDNTNVNDNTQWGNNPTITAIINKEEHSQRRKTAINDNIPVVDNSVDHSVH